MKIPAMISTVVLTLSFGCSDESNFVGASAKVPATPGPVTETDTILPEGDATAEVPIPDESVTEVPEEVETPAVEVPALTLPEAQLVTKVGVNFEDQPGGDADYNDAVLCFKGNFEVTPSIIQSTADQTVEAVLFTEALCTNYILVEITRGDQVISSTTYDPKTMRNANLQFAKGDRLHVSLKSTDCNGGKTFPMTDPDWAKLAPDVCNVQ